MYADWAPTLYKWHVVCVVMCTCAITGSGQCVAMQWIGSLGDVLVVAGSCR